MKRWSFQNATRWDMIFFYYWKGGIFFLETWYFFPGRKTRERWPFSRNNRKHDFFFFDMFHASLLKKKKKRSYPAKIHLKVID